LTKIQNKSCEILALIGCVHKDPRVRLVIRSKQKLLKLEGRRKQQFKEFRVSRMSSQDSRKILEDLNFKKQQLQKGTIVSFVNLRQLSIFRFSLNSLPDNPATCTATSRPSREFSG
jgi:hypothetical protein